MGQSNNVKEKLVFIHYLDTDQQTELIEDTRKENMQSINSPFAMDNF